MVDWWIEGWSGGLRSGFVGGLVDCGVDWWIGGLRGGLARKVSEPEASQTQWLNFQRCTQNPTKDFARSSPNSIES